MKEIITRTEKIRLDTSGVITCEVIKGAYLEFEDAKEIIQAVKDLSNGKRVPVFVDMRNTGGTSKECRAYLAGEEAGKIQSACALLIESSFSRLIGNFFLGLNKTKFPTRLFTTQEAAMEWLHTFL